MRKRTEQVLLRWLYAPLYRLLIRQALKVRNRVVAVIHHQLRYHEDAFEVKGESEYKNKVCFLTAAKLCNLEYGKADREFAAQHQSQIADLLSKSEDVEEIKKFVVIFYELQALIYGLFLKSEEKDRCLGEARKLGRQVRELEVKDLSSVNRSARAELRRLRAEIADRESFKIDFSLSQIGTVLTLFSSLFLVTGFLYNRFLLGAFGVDVSHYFSLTDYLASSIDKIRFAGFGAILATVSSFLRVHYESRSAALRLESTQPKPDYWFYFLIIVLVVGTVKSYFEDSVLFYIQMQLLLFLVGLYFSWPIAKRYFTNPVPAFFSMVFLVTFAADMYASIGSTIHRFDKGDIAGLRNVKVHLTGDFLGKREDLVILSGNSAYLFLFDQQQHNIIVAPKDKVEFIEILRGNP